MTLKGFKKFASTIYLSVQSVKEIKIKKKKKLKYVLKYFFQKLNHLDYKLIPSLFL